MIQLSSLPERLRLPLGELLRPEEILLYAVDATSPRGLQGKTIESWALLTNQTLHLITLQEGHTPRIVTIVRTHLEKVSFAPNKWGVALRFVEKNAKANQAPVQVDFLKEKRTEVNRFCEELWKNVEIEVVKPAVEDASKSAISSAIDLAKITNQADFQMTLDESPTHTVISGAVNDPQPTTVKEWLRVLGGTQQAEPPAGSSAVSPAVSPAGSPPGKNSAPQPETKKGLSKTKPSEELSESQTTNTPSPGDVLVPKSLEKWQSTFSFLGSFLGPMVARIFYHLCKPLGKDD